MADIETCFYCGKPASRICDGIIGRKTGIEIKSFDDFEQSIITCDRPLCDDCVAESATIFFDGVSDRKLAHRDHSL